MINVVCVLRTGGVFTPEYVSRLHDGVDANLTVDYRFNCLTDIASHPVVDERECIIPLEHGWEGWWSKMEAFRIPGPALYLDLDTVIVGNIDRLAQACVSAPRDTLMTITNAWAHGGPDAGGGIWGWSASMLHLYDEFFTTGKRGTTDDQQWINAYAKTARFEPTVDGLYSYKIHCRPNGIPIDARVVYFHGNPRPPAVAWLDKEVEELEQQRRMRTGHA